MLTKQIAAAVGQGEHGDILLATSVREKIVEEYRDDVNPQIKNPDKLALGDQLVIPPAVAPAITVTAVLP